MRSIDVRKLASGRSSATGANVQGGKSSFVMGLTPPVPNRFPKPGRRQDDPLLSMKQEALPVSSATTSSISPRYLCLAKVTPTILILSSVGVWPVLRENTAPIS